MKLDSINNPQVHEIQQEYTKIDHNWLSLHYRISVGVVLFALAVESVMGIMIIHSDMLNTSVFRYILKFIVVPSGVNAVCIAIDTAAIRSKKISQKLKIRTVSMMFVAISFTLFTVHSAFTATYYIFSGAILLTAIYADYSITLPIVFLSMASLILSELFIPWDTDKISIFESTLRMGNFCVALIILSAFSMICLVAIRYMQRKNIASIQLEKERELLQQSLRLDELTGIYNRKALQEAMLEVEKPKPGETHIFAIVDIDKFKTINDNLGHRIGDLCLTKFARCLKENCGSAIPFRYGGDEFCLLFHNMEMDEAVSVCKRIQTELKKIRIKDAPELKVTASFGLANYRNGWNFSRLLVHADRALYQAKVSRDKIKISH